MEGFDAIGLQELGGFTHLNLPWTIVEVELDGNWGFYVANPSLVFRAVAVGLPSRFLPAVDHVRAFCCGICVTLKMDGCKKFIISAHLPHRQRKDCIDTWQAFSNELEHILSHKRYCDSVVILIDSNYEIGHPQQLLDPNAVDERSFLASSFIQRHGLVSTTPQTYTWSNQRGAKSKIDFVLADTSGFSSQGVFEESDEQLGCDHRAVFASVECSGPQLRTLKKRNRAQNKCGKWRVDPIKTLQQANLLAEDLDLNEKDFTIEQLEQLSTACSYRPKSFRYRDPPHILDKIKQRKALKGREGRDLGKEITRMRKDAKARWLTSILDKASKGDPISSVVNQSYICILIIS